MRRFRFVKIRLIYLPPLAWLRASAHNKFCLSRYRRDAALTMTHTTMAGRPSEGSERIATV